MKKILSTLSFVFFTLAIFAQTATPKQLTKYLVGKATLSQTGAATGTLNIRLNGLTDETGFFDGSAVDNTCVLLYRNTDDDFGYFLQILSVITASPTNPVVQVDITGFPALNGAVNGQGVVYKRNSANHFVPFVSGITQGLQQIINEGMVRDLETTLLSTKIYGTFTNPIQAATMTPINGLWETAFNNEMGQPEGTTIRRKN
jgi:hypothetical protein